MKTKNILLVTVFILFNQQTKTEGLVALQTEAPSSLAEKVIDATPEKNVLINQSLINENFSGKNISGWEFENVTIANTNFGGSCAQETTFLKSKLAFVNMSNKTTLLRKILNYITKNSFYAKNRIGIKFTKSIIVETNFSGSILIDSNFYQTDIIKSFFKKTISVNADFIACTIIDTTFKGSVLAYIDFSGSTLKNVDFRNCILIGSNFEGATFENMKVQGVDFRGVKLSDEQKKYLQKNGAKNVYWEDNLLL